MPTRDEMGKALYEANFPRDLRWWDELREEVKEPYREVAEKFAAWLREAEEGNRPRGGAVSGQELNNKYNEFEAAVHKRGQWTISIVEAEAWDRLAQWLRREICRVPVCPKGHMLTHREDIEKRYCGICREYL